jgi:hypothetical protein
MTTTIGPAEHLLPVLFACTEASWTAALLIGLARIHFLGQDNPLLPLWAPFLIISIMSWLSFFLKYPHVQSYRQIPQRMQSLCIMGIQVLLTLLVIWDTLFAASIPLWNFYWLLTLLQDIVQLNTQAFYMLGIILLCYYFFYRGTTIASRTPEPGQITRTMQLGGLIFLGVISVQTATGGQDIQLLLLIPLFLCFALFTRSLAYMLFVRQQHLMGQSRRNTIQDRLLIITVAPICLLLLCIAFVLGIVADPNFLSKIQILLTPLGWLYDALVTVIAILATVLLTPFFYLFKSSNLQSSSFQLPISPFKNRPPGKVQPISPTMISFANILTVVIIIAMIVAIILLVRFALRKYRKRQQSTVEDQHESLWSWSLFWAQVKRSWLSLWQRIFRHSPALELPLEKQTEEGEQEDPDNIRAIYRAFLQWAAGHGYIRQRAETPYEFQRRLAQPPMQNKEPEIQNVTAIYTTARYSQEPLAESDVIRMLQSWNILKQQTPPPSPESR